MGARSAGNPHAACDVEGTGNVARSKGPPAPVLDPRVSERMCKQVSVSLPYRGDSHDCDHDNT